MATAILNPLLCSISGRLGNIVFYMRKGRVCIRSYVVPENPDTKAQREVRERFALAVKSWQNTPETERYKFTRKARNMNMSGYNLFISQYMKEKTAGSMPGDMQINYHTAYQYPYQSRIHSVSNTYQPVYEVKAAAKPPGTDITRSVQLVLSTETGAEFKK